MVTIVGVILLSFLNILISLVIFSMDPLFQWDYIIVNLFILLISQFIGVSFAYFVVIPLFKAKDSEHHPLNGLNSVRTILLLSMTFTVVFASNFILVQTFKILDLIPKSGYNNVLLNSEHLNNPLNILIFYLPITIGAPLYEEVVYRRLLIPLLEERGMTPLIAVMTSSFIFAIAHLPGDLVNGNLPGGVIHVWNVFLIGVSVGLIYVLTRNIIYPIVIHGVLNFISFSGPLVLIMGNNLMIIAYNILFFLVLFLGLGIFLFSLWQYFRKRDGEWVVLIRRKNNNNIKHGTLTFLVIGIISGFIPLGIHFLLLNLAVLEVLLYYLISLGSFGLLIVLFLWLGTRTTYESNKI